MTVALSLWRPRVEGDFPGCPNPIIERAILESAIEFCAGARVWVKQLAAIQILTGIQNYALTSTDGRIIGIKRASIDEKGSDMLVSLDHDRYLWLDYIPSEDSDLYLSLTDLTFAAVGTIVSAATDFDDEGVEAGNELCVTGTSYNNRVFAVDTVSTVTITVDTDVDTVTAEGTADATATITIGGLVVWVYLQPEKDATALPDFLWEDYEEHISDGARWKLFDKKGPWYDPNEAMKYGQRFESRIANALGVTQRGGMGNRRMRARNRRFVV